jgi:D-3-phosphoglycerate dehydrogenase
MRVVVLDDWEGRWRTSPHTAALRAVAEVAVIGEPLAWEELLPRVADAEVLVLNRERTPLPAGRLAQLPRLRLIAQTGTGVPHLDPAAARARGVRIAVTPGASARSVAELAIGMAIALTRRLPELDAAVRAGGWPRPITPGLLGETLGILGLGEIGRETARLGVALGMRVLAWGPTLTAERAAAAGAELVPLAELFARSRVVSVHLRLVPATRALVTGELLARLGPQGYLVNTARAEVVDMQALRRLLAEGRLGGAGLDVFDAEPLPPDDPLRSCPRVLLAPHVGWMTDAAWDAFIARSVANVLAFARGEPFPEVG